MIMIISLYNYRCYVDPYIKGCIHLNAYLERCIIVLYSPNE